MKKYFITLFLSLIIGYCFAQPGKKQPKPNEKPSIREMKEEMENMSPEEKEMLKKMGLDKAMDNINKMDGKQMQKAFENANLTVPKRDAARIAAIPQKPLTPATISAQLASVHVKVLTVLKPAAKQAAENIYTELKKTNTSAAIGNAAAGLWMMGKNEIALYIIGKVCNDDPTNTDNISNYAAMLSMNAGQHLALPFLNYLNTKFPKNSTILNNIGQAWFGLGEINKAEKYLDSAIQLYSYHPQANFTKCVIQESKGETTKAIEAGKRGIKKAHSVEKQHFLQKRLQYKLQPKDIDWNFPMPQDPLGLEKFVWPDYPMHVDQVEALTEDWNKFIQECNEVDVKLEFEENRLSIARQELAEKWMKLSSKGKMIQIPVPFTAHKADKKLKYLVEEKDGTPITEHQKRAQLFKALDEAETIKERRDALYEKLQSEWNKKFGEGKENPFEEACSAFKEANTAFLKEANELLLDANTNYLKFLRRLLNDQVYYSQYTKLSLDFELEKVTAKRKWLSEIKSQKLILLKYPIIGIYCQKKEDKESKTNKLAEFDDVACRYHSEIKFPIGKITIDCSRMTTEFEFKFIKLGLRQDMDRDNFEDQFIGATVEVGVEVGVEVELGPGTVGATAGVGVGIEIDRTGISDVYATGKAGVGATAGPVNVDAGAEGRISIISGQGIIDGTGILKGKI